MLILANGHPWKQLLGNSYNMYCIIIHIIFSKLFEWAVSNEARPAGGSLVQLITKNGETEYVIA